MASKYTRSAKGKACTVRMPEVCNHNPETVVFAHLNGGGAGMKHSPIHGCYACSDCHFWLDIGYVESRNPVDKLGRDLEHYRAMVETQQIMIKEGILVL